MIIPDAVRGLCFGTILLSACGSSKGGLRAVASFNRVLSPKTLLGLFRISVSVLLRSSSVGASMGIG